MAYQNTECNPIGTHSLYHRGVALGYTHKEQRDMSPVLSLSATRALGVTSFTSRRDQGTCEGRAIYVQTHRPPFLRSSNTQGHAHMKTYTITFPLIGQLTLVRLSALFAMPLHSEKLTYANGTKDYRVAWGRLELYLTPWSTVKAVPHIPPLD